MADELTVDYRTENHDELDPIKEVVEALSRAKSTISGTIYKVRQPAIFEALEEKAEEGIEIHLLVHRPLVDIKKPGLRTSERMTDRQVRNELDRLALKYSNVKVKKWTKKGKLHIKLLIIDEKHVITGSFNWNEAAVGMNAELFIELRGQEYGREFTELFERLWKERGLKLIKPE